MVRRRMNSGRARASALRAQPTGCCGSTFGAICSSAGRGRSTDEPGGATTNQAMVSDLPTVPVMPGRCLQVEEITWWEVCVPAEDIRPVYASEECEVDLRRRELQVRGFPVPVGGRAFEIIDVLA